MSAPSKSTLPLSSASSPVTALTNDVLPEPFGPIMPSVSPERCVTSTLRNACTPPKRLQRLCAANRSVIGNALAITCERTAQNNERPGATHQRAVDAARHQHDYCDNQRAVDHVFERVVLLQHERHRRENERADDRTHQRAAAAERDHQPNTETRQEIEAARRGKADISRIKRAADAGEQGACEKY